MALPQAPDRRRPQYVAWMKRSVIQEFSVVVDPFFPYFAALHTGYASRRHLSNYLIIHGNA